jgi:adenylate cyclase
MNNNYKEIERKFLVDEKNLPDLKHRDYHDIIQGYIQNIGGQYIYRLRQVLFATADGDVLGDRYYQTIKGKGSKTREEYEIPIFKPQFSVMWRLCNNISLHKFRYLLTEFDVKDDGIPKEVFLDVYKNELSGLYTVEVEFENEEDCDAYVPEAWFGEEVTEDGAYSNFRLAIDGRPVE